MRERAASGAETHREMAREMAMAWWAACDLKPDIPMLEDHLVAFAARVEADTLERARNAMCMGCERGWPVARQTAGALALYHTIPPDARDEDEDEHLYCEAEEIRALASEPVAGEARPSGPREA